MFIFQHYIYNYIYIYIIIVNIYIYHMYILFSAHTSTQCVTRGFVSHCSKPKAQEKSCQDSLTIKSAKSWLNAMWWQLDWHISKVMAQCHVMTAWLSNQQSHGPMPCVKNSWFWNLQEPSKSQDPRCATRPWTKGTANNVVYLTMG